MVCHIVARAPERGVLRDGGQEDPIIDEGGTDAGDDGLVFGHMFEDIKRPNHVERVAQGNRSSIGLKKLDWSRHASARQRQPAWMKIDPHDTIPVTRIGHSLDDIA